MSQVVSDISQLKRCSSFSKCVLCLCACSPFPLYFFHIGASVHSIQTSPSPCWPLWQKVSRRSSPDSTLATHRSLLLMKAMKLGFPGQILGSMRVPEHWVLISTGFMGEPCQKHNLFFRTATLSAQLWYQSSLGTKKVIIESTEINSDGK